MPLLGCSGGPSRTGQENELLQLQSDYVTVKLEGDLQKMLEAEIIEIHTSNREGAPQVSLRSVLSLEALPDFMSVKFQGSFQTA